MEQLTKKEIAFIDKYLRNSGIEFLDVRIEMTDHVASVIEQELELNRDISFYDAFKSYMIKNKKHLLRNANKHKWAVDRKVLKGIKKELFGAPALLVGIGLTTVLWKLDLAELKNSLWFKVLFSNLLLSAYLVPAVMYYRFRISFLNRLFIYAFLLNQLFLNLIMHVELSPHYLGFGYGLMIWLNFGMLMTGFKISTYYKEQYSDYEKAQ